MKSILLKLPVIAKALTALFAGSVSTAAAMPIATPITSLISYFLTVEDVAIQDAIRIIIAYLIISITTAVAVYIVPNKDKDTT